MAHAGGAKEAPANTLFAFKKALENGADSLEMDGYVTADGVFVVTHDSSPNATSDIANTPYAGMTVDQMTLAQLKTLDFAYKFNIDMKAPSNNQQMATDAADVLAALMQDYEPERSADVIVASFWQGAMERFHELLPEHKALTASQDELLDYALHVWPQNGSVDGPELWQKMIDQGANGFFTDFPSQMQQFLCDKGIPKPDGSLRCPEQQCPDGYTGYAPNCEQIPVCPEGEEGTPPDCHKPCPVGSVLDGDTCRCPPGQTGTPPHCEPHGDPGTVLTKLSISPRKGKIKAGKAFKMKLKIKAKSVLTVKKPRKRAGTKRR